MAEIKSALEIALERAAALGAGQDDSQRQAQEQGQAQARRVLQGEAEPASLAELPPGHARRAAAQSMLDALAEGRLEALEGLQALAGAEAVGAWQKVARAVEVRTQAQAVLDGELADEMRQELAGLGVGGGALRPNPRAHQDYQARAAQALAKPNAALQAAGDELLAALEG